MPIKLEPLSETDASCPTGGGSTAPEEPAAPIPAGSPGNVVLEALEETQSICELSPLGFAYGYFGGSEGEGQARSAIIGVHGDLDGLNEDDHKHYQLRTEKGEISGYAELDLFGKIPASQHGNQPGGSLHDLATDTVAGFMSPSDKDTVDNLTFPLPVVDGGTGVVTVNQIRELLGLVPVKEKFPVTVIDTLVFVLSATPLADSERVYLNGQWLQKGASDDYTISGTTVTLLRPTRPGDLISVEYSRF